LLLLPLSLAASESQPEEPALSTALSHSAARSLFVREGRERLRCSSTPPTVGRSVAVSSCLVCLPQSISMLVPLPFTQTHIRAGPRLAVGLAWLQDLMLVVLHLTH